MSSRNDILQSVALVISITVSGSYLLSSIKNSSYFKAAIPKISTLEASSETLDKQQLKSLDEEIAVHKKEIAALNETIASIKTAGPTYDSKYFTTYDLDRYKIYLAKYRTIDQREYWIQNNNESSNFSEETIDWLRTHDTFYITTDIDVINGKAQVDDKAFLMLPPCPALIGDIEGQPVIKKSRLIIIREASREEYEFYRSGGT